VRLGGVLVGAHVDEAVVVARVGEQAGEVVVEAELLFLLKPNCCSAAAAVWLSTSNSGAPSMTGSPQAMRTDWA